MSEVQLGHNWVGPYYAAQAEHGSALDVMRAIKQALDPDN